jgi:hypothetical protein
MVVQMINISNQRNSYAIELSHATELSHAIDLPSIKVIPGLTTSDTQQQKPRKYERIPLSELILTGGMPTCNPGTHLISSTILPESITHANRNIPKVIHMTSKSRCTVQVFEDNIDKWRFEDHSFYFHDDEAVEGLLQKHWPEFPYLQMMRDCMISGAAKADLWRYLILYEYGGIYTDIDNAPGQNFLNGSVITAEDDSWYVVEGLGMMSQYFMASSPRHPFLHLCVSVLLGRLLWQPSVGNQYVPFSTGPGTTKNAMIQFMRGQGNEYQKTPAGHYVGLHNRSVTVVGTRGTGRLWVIRESIGGQDKRKGYAQMNMKHFSQSKRLPQAFVNESCHAHLYFMSAKDYVVHENDTTRQDVMNTSSSAAAAAAAPTE